jgi:transcriptional regulator with XRE-family HTH domain
MTPEELLRLYPRETLRWLRGRLGLSQIALARRIGASFNTVANWESRRYAPSPAYREQLVDLLTVHLATPEGAAFVGSLGRGGDAAGGNQPPPHNLATALPAEGMPPREERGSYAKSPNR